MYSDRGSWVFIHIPKAAGTSVRNALMKHDDSNNQYWGPKFVPQLQRTVDKAHIQAHELYAFPELETRIRTHLVFAVVRNPMDRFISAYNYTRSRRIHDMSVGDLLKLITEYPALTVADMRFVHFCPQKNFLVLPNGKMVADFVTSNPNALVTMVANHMGMAIVMGHDNESSKAGSLRAEDLTTEEKGLINAFYAKDYLYFGDHFGR
jgi:hypothetical protein